MKNLLLLVLSLLVINCGSDNKKAVEEEPTTANEKKFPLNSRRTAAGLPTELPANL